MKIKMLFVAMAVFVMASVSHAQFNAFLLNFTPLTDQCDGGGTPLGAGCWAEIYWDANANGPGDDNLVPVGAGFGQANFNMIDMQSGADLLEIPGGFATEDPFTINTTTPAPSLYYIVVECGGVRWTSANVQIANGLNEYEITGWVCEVTEVPCDEPTQVDIFTQGGRDFVANGPYYQCVRMCADAPLTICLGPLRADERPHASLLPGCLHGVVGCDVECPPAQFTYDDAGWTYNPTNGTWCNVVVPATDGCACFCLETIEGVVDVNFAATAGDRSVDLAWNTSAERDMVRYNVMRRMVGHDFAQIGSVEAANSTSGASYTFVDNDASNGTTYEYTLEVVDLNGASMLGTIASATPSTGAAVITEYALHQNYPNPFNPSTNLVFDVVTENNVNLTVYNAMGQEVASLVNGTVGAGRHTVSFDASNLTSGLYFYTVKIGNEFTATKKMLLVK